ncbi:MAG: methyltransferase domain-containing protein [Zoogloeaceae bacterium]|jgi:tRNA G46 methylase TrmB|nr:methyltransferase domain-containing protein [Zoogloeaceae bacterium]
MFANSRPVSSRQTSIHPHLEQVLARHFVSSFLRPVHNVSFETFDGFLRAFEQWESRRRENKRKNLILDAGCGVGWSSVTLARRHPDCFVLGVDQSAHRLARGGKARAENAQDTGNLHFARADLVDFWRLLQMANLKLRAQYLLYPNPWPKPAHLRRRWHGHPVFPVLLSLGGFLECRSNWKIYVDELAFACFSGGYAAQTTLFTPDTESGNPIFLTPFERKYHASGQTLWRLVCDLNT